MEGFKTFDVYETESIVLLISDIREYMIQIIYTVTIFRLSVLGNTCPFGLGEEVGAALMTELPTYPVKGSSQT